MQQKSIEKRGACWPIGFNCSMFVSYPDISYGAFSAHR